MDKNWSELNKEMQALIAKRATFKDGIGKLLQLRRSLFEQIAQIVTTFPEEAFWQMPFAGAEGYHSKTLAYSIWHIFRIEDIVAHEMIAEDQQVLFSRDFQTAMRSPIITTGNELAGNEIAEFSRRLNIQALYRYAQEVMQSTDRILTALEYPDLKRRFGEDMIAKLQGTGCVSGSERANWLISYWCGRDVLGLVKMPFSRHWIMHIEAMRRIKNRLCKLARKGVDPIAFCGFSCNHCFLGAWCGSCRTAYNVCAFATASPDGQCPNAVCCQEKGIDGCYECDNLESCEVGFYIPANDGAQAAKAQAMYIRKHGKKAFLRVHDRLHQKYDFAKTQEILGQDCREGLRILEESSEGSAANSPDAAWNQMEYTLVSLRERPELMEAAATWFHEKWGVPREAYLECMAAYLNGDTEYAWVLCLHGEDIVGGLGVIENDFHDRPDLAPNVCAVYTEPAFRGRGIAGRMLEYIVESMRDAGVSPLYLVTDHVGFYERYGWEFVCPAHEADGGGETRVYMHR